MTIVAAVLLPFALMQADVAAAPSAQDLRYARCVALIESDAPRAYEDGMIWANEGEQLGGYRCAALALVAQGQYHEGARRLASLAGAVNTATPAVRAELFSQAGNAYLLGREPGQARSVFTQAIATMAPGAEALPDLYIDRARSYAMERDYRHAEEDLSSAIDLRADDALALRLRASARLHQNAFPLAEADAQRALTVATTEQERVDAALVLGHVRESIRTGTAVEEQ